MATRKTTTRVRKVRAVKTAQVIAHKRATKTVKCDKCGGKGIWYGRGYLNNGKWVGPTGPCFACGGKGKQTPADQERNYWYWRRYARVSA